jgi:hypothetical protein
MAWMRAALARMLMLTAWVATAAAGLLIVGKAAMALLVAAAREPTATVPAGGLVIRRGEVRKGQSVA